MTDKQLAIFTEEIRMKVRAAIDHARDVCEKNGIDQELEQKIVGQMEYVSMNLDIIIENLD